jgi:hypothetical protein
MNALATILRWELFFVLIALAAIVAYRMITQQINVTGLLMDKTGGRVVSPARVQMLMATMGMVAYYVMLAFESKDKGRLPELPNEYLAAFGASHGIYLLGKLYGRFATTPGIASPKARERAKPIERETNQ